MRLIDTHCHLDFDRYDEDREQVIQECAERMELVVNSGTNVDRNERSLELAAEHSHIAATLGIHPTYITDLDDDHPDRVEQQIRDNQDRIAGIGEIGLDYHHVTDDAGRERQEDWYRQMLALAEELGQPVVLHTRDAEPRSLEIVAGYDLPGVVLHCFNGAPALAEDAVDRGYYVSVSTQVLYSSRVQTLAETVPLDHILLETDAPFLYPDGRNVPWHVEASAEEIARIKEVAPDTVAEQTTENAYQVLALDR